MKNFEKNVPLESNRDTFIDKHFYDSLLYKTFGYSLCCALLILSSFSVCIRASAEPAPVGFGPNPTLPEPEKSLVPTVKVATAIGWPAEKTPKSVAGTRVVAFAKDLAHPRWIYVLPNGDVLVAETNAPAKPEDKKGVKGWAMGVVMKRAGAAEPGANRIKLLRDTNGDGIADLQTNF